ncbi:sugar transferase [Alicyclobacillus macrosporangiidus]|uniref:sugar transferase n=1 Tax=Alicyclobacillus macrosporangiidus TaxID=392015 RepID=UPI0004986801|nr:sugar transferase [Alicyclobacillus macrosporangiidus]
MFRTHQLLLVRLLQIADGAIVIASFLLAWYVKFMSGWLSFDHHLPFSTYFLAVLLSVPVFILINLATGLYQPTRVKSLSSQLVTIVRSSLLGLLIFMSGLYFLKLSEFSRDVLVIFSVSYVTLLTVERLAIRVFLRVMRSRGYNQKFILVVGWNAAMKRFIQGLEAHPWFGYRVIGYLSEEADGHAMQGVPCIGRVDDLHSVLQNHVIDHVIIALPRTEIAKMAEVIHVCELMGTQSLIVPDYFDLLPARPRFETFGDMPLIDTRYVPLDDALNAALKRTFDIVFSALVLVLFSPLFLIIAIGVKLSSPGPVFFVQYRVGKNRRIFPMYKFRTMYHDGRQSHAVGQRHQGDPLLDNSAVGECSASSICFADDDGWTIPNDPRRTKFGAFLRRTSLDELPQFWNVLVGDMSVIGPRPERPNFVEKFKDEIPRYMVKHRVRPGITGWAQVHGWRGDTSIAERIRYDIEYIENWSFGMDLRIILKTLRHGFTHPNAY